jgi:hypothetical protein
VHFFNDVPLRFKDCHWLLGSRADEAVSILESHPGHKWIDTMKSDEFMPCGAYLTILDWVSQNTLVNGLRQIEMVTNFSVDTLSLIANTCPLLTELSLNNDEVNKRPMTGDFLECTMALSSLKYLQSLDLGVLSPLTADSQARLARFPVNDLQARRSCAFPSMQRFALEEFKTTAIVDLIIWALLFIPESCKLLPHGVLRAYEQPPGSRQRLSNYNRGRMVAHAFLGGCSAEGPLLSRDFLLLVTEGICRESTLKTLSSCLI